VHKTLMQSINIRRAAVVWQELSQMRKEQIFREVVGHVTTGCSLAHARKELRHILFPTGPHKEIKTVAKAN